MTAPTGPASASDMTGGGVRPARPADVPALVHLRAVMFAEMLLLPRIEHDLDADWALAARDWFAAAMQDPAVCLVVADETRPVAAAGEVVACAVGELERGCPTPRNPAGLEVYLGNVVTLPEARHQGHAGACVDAVLAWARTTGALSVELHASPEGQGMYERRGFLPTANPSMRLRL